MEKKTCEYCIFWTGLNAKFLLGACKRLYNGSWWGMFDMRDSDSCSKWSSKEQSSSLKSEVSDGLDDLDETPRYLRSDGRYVYICESCGRRVTKWLAEESLYSDESDLCPDCEIDGYKEDEDSYFPCSTCEIEDCLSPDCRLDCYISNNDNYSSCDRCDREECLSPEMYGLPIYPEEVGLSCSEVKEDITEDTFTECSIDQVNILGRDVNDLRDEIGDIEYTINRYVDGEFDILKKKISEIEEDYTKDLDTKYFQEQLLKKLEDCIYNSALNNDKINKALWDLRERIDSFDSRIYSLANDINSLRDIPFYKSN